MDVTNLIKKFTITSLMILMLNLVVALPLPCEYWGTAILNGELVKDDISVEAYIDGELYAIMQSGTLKGHYQIVIKADDPAIAGKNGGQEGDDILIKVGGKTAVPTLKWISGPEIIWADLTVLECTANSDCSDGNICTDDVCDANICKYIKNNANCNDGAWCTVNDICSGGMCLGIPRNCGDGDACTADSCDENSNQCVHQNICECSSNEDCSDGNICTDDVCDNGICRYTNNNANCNDGIGCTVNDICSGGMCSGTLKNCNDGNACTADSCDEHTGQCTHQNICGCTSDADCDDSNTCTIDICDESHNCVYNNTCTICTPNWKCNGWGECTGGIKSRACVDLNGCGADEGKPQETELCSLLCIPDWKCTKWGDCEGGEKERDCVDLSNCGTNEGKPREEKDCDDDDNEVYVHEAPEKTDKEEVKEVSKKITKLSKGVYGTVLPPGYAVLETEPKRNIRYSVGKLYPITIGISFFIILASFLIILFVHKKFKKNKV